MARVLEYITVYLPCHPHVYPQMEYALLANFTLQPQIIIAFWPVVYSFIVPLRIRG